jgi:hypothetical protein
MKREKRIVTVDRNLKNLTNPKVQIWSASGTYMTSVLNSEACVMVKTGKYGISTDQAIFEIPTESKYIIYK